jgi:hypothetical protein
MARHPAAWATSPLRVRDTSVPATKPAITVPITRPRDASSARSPAIGMAICPATVVSPISVIAPSSTPNVGATAQPSSATAEQTSITGISRRRFSESPSGTISTMPTA